jgi:hypothetical protein
MKMRFHTGRVAAILAVLVVGAAGVYGQSTQVAPLVREVNSQLMHDLLESMDALLDAINASLGLDATHDAAVPSTGPVPHLEAASDVSANTAVADGDAVRAAGDLIGRQLDGGPCDRGGRVGAVTTVTDGSSTSAISAGGAGVYLEVYDVVIANTSAGTAVTVDIRDGTGGSVLGTFPAPAATSGVAYSFRVPLTGSANTAIAVDPSASATSVIVTLRGCKAK